MNIEFNKVTWYSKFGAMILFLFVIPWLAFYIGEKYQEVKMLNQLISFFDKNNKSENPVKSFLNLKYKIDDQEITLINGKSENTEVFGQPIEGDLNNDGINDVISLIYQQTSGTGTFFYVVGAVGSKNGFVSTKNSIFLGDRIAPQNIRVINGIAQVNYAIRKDNDPMTEQPSMGVTKYLKIVNGELVEGK